MKILPKTSAAIFISMFFLPGCTIMDGNAIVTGERRSPISPDQVRLYRAVPERYEEIALVNSSAGHDFRSNSGLVNSAIERLKKEAARVGANGVVIGDLKERDAPITSMGFGSSSGNVSGTITGPNGWSTFNATGNSTSRSFGIIRGDTYTRIQGLAIYVP
jgi:hypothetical protein